MSTLRFPYGIADFEKIASRRFFYVDRTDRIARVEEIGDQLLLLRPCRFGKSLWLSVLENYYALDRADQFEALFGHLKIGQAPTPRRNSYFILKWSFSWIDPTGDTDAIRNAVFDHINGCVEEFIIRYQDRLAHRIELDPANAMRSFQSLLAAAQKSPHQLYLLIDEYDNFANEVLASRDRGEDRYRDLVGGEGVIKTVFKAVKAAAEGRGLDRVFITGVSRVVMADITSGYNLVWYSRRAPPSGATRASRSCPSLAPSTWRAELPGLRVQASSAPDSPRGRGLCWNRPPTGDKQSSERERRRRLVGTGG